VPQHPDRAWQITLGRIAALLAGGALLGIWLQATSVVLLIICAGLLIFNLWNLRRLGLRLRRHRRLPPAEGWGIWAEIYHLLSRRQRADFERKRRLVGLLRAFRDGAAALPDATVLLDDSRRLLWFNRAAQRLLGLNYPRDLGGYFSNLVRAPRVSEWLQADPAAEPLTDVASPAGDAVRLSLRLIPYADGQSMLVARDVSKLMQLEQVRRDFVANVSHELRTPLTVVHGYLDMLEPEQLAESAPILAELRNQSRRMTQIVEDLLTLSRLEAQEGVGDERVVMRSLLNTLKREAEALSQGRHTISLERASECDLKGSAKELHSAFSNLVSNAVRYTPAGGRIQIHWSASDNGAAFTVIDSGQGIPPQHLPRITERFYRVSTSRSRESGGTGLGLSIVKHVLNLHGARLEIHSEVGVGSTFACVFGPEHLLQPQSLTEEA
jgi:two-component system, OmpR family, phosphate regulon sensor histidine kinase PhoR